MSIKVNTRKRFEVVIQKDTDFYSKGDKVKVGLVTAHILCRAGVIEATKAIKEECANHEGLQGWFDETPKKKPARRAKAKKQNA